VEGKKLFKYKSFLLSILYGFSFYLILIKPPGASRTRLVSGSVIYNCYKKISRRFNEKKCKKRTEKEKGKGERKFLFLPQMNQGIDIIP
jgi:hypothetical protein